LDDVADETWLSPFVEVYHITEGTVGESWTVYRDVVLPAPVGEAVFVLNLFTNACDDL